MKNKTLLWITMALLIPGPALAAGEDWISKNNQFFFYGMIGFGALAAILIVWEVIYQVASAQSANAPAKMSVITQTPTDTSDDHDPIKALLQEQIKGDGKGAQDESSLPSFLRSSAQGDADKAENLGAPSPPPSEDDDPFKRLLQKSGSAEKPGDKSPQPPGARKKILPPIRPTSPGQTGGGDDDPFKKLLIKSTDNTPASSPEKLETLGASTAAPPREAPKKLAFNMPKSAKPSGAARLFDRISEASSDAGAVSGKPPAPKSVKPAAPRKLSLGGVRKSVAAITTPEAATKPSEKPAAPAQPAAKRLELKFKPRKK